jgi:hypothetical protein
LHFAAAASTGTLVSRWPVLFLSLPNFGAASCDAALITGFALEKQGKSRTEANLQFAARENA